MEDCFLCIKSYIYEVQLLTLFFYVLDYCERATNVLNYISYLYRLPHVNRAFVEAATAFSNFAKFVSYPFKSGLTAWLCSRDGRKMKMTHFAGDSSSSCHFLTFFISSNKNIMVIWNVFISYRHYIKDIQNGYKTATWSFFISSDIFHNFPVIKNKWTN